MPLAHSSSEQFEPMRKTNNNINNKGYFNHDNKKSYQYI